MRKPFLLLRNELNRIKRNRQKYMDMYTDDLITRDELNDKIGKDKLVIERLQGELKMVEQRLTKSDRLQAILNETFKGVEDICNLKNVTNAQLKQIIEIIDVDHEGNVK